MGLLYRCTSCEREMVLESYHRGRVVPCPWCGGQEDVPESLDFQSVYQSRTEDEGRGRLLLTLAVVGAPLCCLPVEAVVWWMSAGRVVRAREENREPDPLLLNARVLAAVCTVLHLLVWVLGIVQGF